MTAAPPAQAPGHILIVDDDPDIRDIMSQVLQLEGYHTLVAANGIEALAQLRRPGRIHLILLDLMMPFMNGWEFRREQERDPKLAAIPVVVLSGDGQFRDKQKALRAADGLLKPVELDDLLAVVERYCDSR